MGNVIEKFLPKNVRIRFRQAIPAALLFFLALQYNSFIIDFFKILLPDSTSLIGRGVLLLFLTFGIAYLLAFLDKALDGR